MGLSWSTIIIQQFFTSVTNITLFTTILLHYMCTGTFIDLPMSNQCPVLYLAIRLRFEDPKHIIPILEHLDYRVRIYLPCL